MDWDERLAAMCAPKQQTWALSPNDIEAIRTALKKALAYDEASGASARHAAVDLSTRTVAELDIELARTIAHESAVIARMTKLRRQDPKL